MTLAHDIARAILSGFDKHYRIFREMASGAKGRFERGDWAAVQHASRERIDLYDLRVWEAVNVITERFPAARADESLWPQIKRAFIELLYDHQQAECAETFFNSVACRVLDRAYYRNEYIFWRPAISTDFIDTTDLTFRSFYVSARGLRRTVADIIGSFQLDVPFEDLARDVRRIVHRLRRHYRGTRVRQPNLRVDVLSSLFFRNTGAYIVGRVLNGADELPFAVSLRHANGGGALYVDALLLTPAQIGRLFNLARAYFTVDMAVPSAVVEFLHGLIPDHTIAELYTAVGLHKQGKTLFYRHLHAHLNHSIDQFVIAPGVRGMVMVVFTLPSFPYVFKMIRDSFKAPKQTSREEVMRKYLLVKHHDRVGRMADTLEYSEVAFPLARFDATLLAELETACGSMIERSGDQLVLKHLYIERRMVPLDVFLRTAEPHNAKRAIEEFGRAIRELAEADIFPGDLLCKNFGVTRAGRVVFYDYDEVSHLTDVTFRTLPEPRNDADVVAAEPWYHVGPNDAFPEEWPTYLFQSAEHRQLFLAMYPELADAAWWSARQDDVRRGTMAELYPYPDDLRFPLQFRSTR